MTERTFYGHTPDDLRIWRGQCYVVESATVAALADEVERQAKLIASAETILTGFEILVKSKNITISTARRDALRQVHQEWNKATEGKQDDDVEPEFALRLLMDEFFDALTRLEQEAGPAPTEAEIRHTVLQQVRQWCEENAFHDSTNPYDFQRISLSQLRAKLYCLDGIPAESEKEKKPCIPMLSGKPSSGTSVEASPLEDSSQAGSLTGASSAVEIAPSIDAPIPPDGYHLLPQGDEHIVQMGEMTREHPSGVWWPTENIGGRAHPTAWQAAPDPPEPTAEERVSEDLPEPEPMPLSAVVGSLGRIEGQIERIIEWSKAFQDPAEATEDDPYPDATRLRNGEESTLPPTTGNEG